MVFQKEYWNREALDTRRHPSHSVIKSFVLPKIKEISSVIDIKKDMKLLDVGAGNGFFSYYFDSICRTTAVDYSAKMNELNPVEDKHVMDAEQLGFDQASFDIVFSHALLHHVADVRNVVNEMIRVSSRYIIIIEPNRDNPLMFAFSAIVPEERKALKFSLNYLRKLLSNKNLRLVDSFTYGMTVPNKTPSFLLPFLSIFDRRLFLIGMYNVVIAEKI